jgi:hypothetical protein
MNVELLRNSPDRRGCFSACAAMALNALRGSQENVGLADIDGIIGRDENGLVNMVTGAAAVASRFPDIGIKIWTDVNPYEYAENGVPYLDNLWGSEEVQNTKKTGFDFQGDLNKLRISLIHISEAESVNFSYEGTALSSEDFRELLDHLDQSVLVVWVDQRVLYNNEKLGCGHFLVVSAINRREGTVRLLDPGGRNFDGGTPYVSLDTLNKARGEQGSVMVFSRR